MAYVHLKLRLSRTRAKCTLSGKQMGVLLPNWFRDCPYQ